MLMHRPLTLLLLFITTMPAFAQVWSIKDLNGEVKRVAISPDSTIILASMGSEVVAWRTADGKELWRAPIGAESAPRLGNRGFVRTHGYVLSVNERVLAFTLADGKVHEVAKDVAVAFDTLFANTVVVHHTRCM